MWRYIREAFWARPALPGVGRLPWNALAVAGAAILGFGEHAIWLGALGLETIYLYGLAGNPRFRNVVDSAGLQRLQLDGEQSRQFLIRALAEPARLRFAAIEEKRARIEQLYTDNQTEDFLVEGNRDALQRLSWLFLKLLTAQRNLYNLSASESEVKRQADAIEQELASGTISGPLLESKQATLQIVRQRLRNLKRRQESLAEIASDLTRIEAQFDLALEDASLKGKPSAISSNISLVSQLLDDSYGDEAAAVRALDTTYESHGAGLEN